MRILFLLQSRLLPIPSSLKDVTAEWVADLVNKVLMGKVKEGDSKDIKLLKIRSGTEHREIIIYV